MRLARRLGVDRAVKFLGSLQTSDVVRSSEFDALKHRIDALEKTAHETKVLFIVLQFSSYFPLVCHNLKFLGAWVTDELCSEEHCGKKVL